MSGSISALRALRARVLEMSPEEREALDRALLAPISVAADRRPCNMPSVARIRHTDPIGAVEASEKYDQKKIHRPSAAK
jgi:hypothetical protein